MFGGHVITCPACGELMLAHRDGKCSEVALDEIADELDWNDGLRSPDEYAGIIVELITLRHEAEMSEEGLDALADRLADFASLDLAILLKMSLSVVYGFLEHAAEGRREPVEAVIQEIGLKLASQSTEFG